MPRTQAGVAIYRIHGPVLFGSADKLDVVREELDGLPPVVIVRLRNMTAIDGTGLHALENLADLLHSSGREIILCGMREQPARLMDRAEFHRNVGEENIVGSVDEAVARAAVLLKGCCS